MQISLARRPALGLGLSLLVHAAVLAWLAHLAPRWPVHEAPPARLQVTLRRLPPPRPEPVATPALTPPPSPAAPARSKAAKPVARAQRPAASAEPTPAPAPGPIIALPPDGKAGAASGAERARGDATAFDLQAARGTARAWVKGEGRGRGGADGLGTPMRPTRSEQLGQAIERARRPDCRGAYSGMGVLAVIPLAKDALTGTGCKW